MTSQIYVTSTSFNKTVSAFHLFCCSVAIKSADNLELIFLTHELSLINTCCRRADHEILMHDSEAGVH